MSGGGGPPTAEVPAAGLVATVIDLVVPPDAVPARVTHRIDYALPPDAPALALIGSRRIDGPELAVDPREPVVVAPPLRGAGWFTASGCCVAGGYVAPHRAGRMAVDGARYLKNEAFAVDWVRLRGGRFAEGDGTRNEQHLAFGAEVVAAAAGHGGRRPRRGAGGDALPAADDPAGPGRLRRATRWWCSRGPASSPPTRTSSRGASPCARATG